MSFIRFKCLPEFTIFNGFSNGSSNLFGYHPTNIRVHVACGPNGCTPGVCGSVEPAPFYRRSEQHKYAEPVLREEHVCIRKYCTFSLCYKFPGLTFHSPDSPFRGII